MEYIILFLLANVHTWYHQFILDVSWSYECTVAICHFWTADTKRSSKTNSFWPTSHTVIMFYQQNTEKARSHKWFVGITNVSCTQLSKHMNFNNYYRKYFECHTSFSKSRVSESRVSVNILNAYNWELMWYIMLTTNPVKYH